MTDNEIIKALKSDIRLADYIDSDYCGAVDKALIQSAINSINRLQAKVIKEQNKNSKLRNERNHLQAEIERLKEEKSKLENKIDEMYPLVMQLPNAMQQAKSEAYKEFADRLKELDGYDNHTFDDCVSLLVSNEYIKGRYEKINEIWNTIDNLLKELVGEDNAKEKE